MKTTTVTMKTTTVTMPLSPLSADLFCIRRESRTNILCDMLLGEKLEFDIKSDGAIIINRGKKITRKNLVCLASACTFSTTLEMPEWLARKIAEMFADREPVAVTMPPQHPSYPFDTFSVGDRCAVSRYTDIEPATVVKVSPNGRTVTIRIDSAQLAEGEKPIVVPGGFSGHCTNQSDLRYDIAENPAGHLEVLSLRSWRGRHCWTPAGCSPDGRQYLRLGWRKFYDYNF